MMKIQVLVAAMNQTGIYRIKKIFFKTKEYALFVLGGYKTVKTHQIQLLSREDSLKRVLQNSDRAEYKGFIRFGDGEYQLMNGLSIAYQKASKELAHELKNALKNNSNLDIDIGVDIPSYKEIKSMKLLRRPIYWPWSRYYVKNCDPQKQYLYTGFTMPYLAAKRKDVYDREIISAYMEKFQDLFNEKRVVLFIGEGIFTKIRHFPFDKCEELNIEKCPSSDSYSEAHIIIERAEKYSNDYLLCFVIGPASKVISYSLMKKGYRCFDLGHFLKDYDMFTNELDIDEEEYFSPDK